MDSHSCGCHVPQPVCDCRYTSSKSKDVRLSRYWWWWSMILRKMSSWPTLRVTPQGVVTTAVINYDAFSFININSSIWQWGSRLYLSSGSSRSASLGQENTLHLEVCNRTVTLITSSLSIVLVLNCHSVLYEWQFTQGPIHLTVNKYMIDYEKVLDYEEVFTWPKVGRCLGSACVSHKAQRTRHTLRA